MALRFCGACGAPAQLGASFCVMCGKPLVPIEGAAAPPAAPLPPGQAPGTGTPAAGPGYGYAPPTAYPTPYTVKKPTRRGLWVALGLVVAAVVVIGIVAALLLSAPPGARFVDIAKTGLVGSSMTFDVTLRTSGGSIDPDRLHVNIRSIHYGTEYDAVQYYNIDRIPTDTTFTWSVDVRVDPYDLGSFTYTFAIEVNGAQTDSRTVV